MKKNFIYFELQNELFALNIENIKEAVEINNIMPIPSAPYFIEGLINYRGDIIPVINLRKKFKFKENDKNQIALICYLKFENQIETFAIIVDKILNVISVEEYEIADFPDLGSKYNTEFISGIIKLNENLIIVLNIEKIFNSSEVEIIKKITNEKNKSVNN